MVVVEYEQQEQVEVGGGGGDAVPQRVCVEHSNGNGLRTEQRVPPNQKIEKNREQNLSIIAGVLPDQ